MKSLSVLLFILLTMVRPVSPGLNCAVGTFGYTNPQHITTCVSCRSGTSKNFIGIGSCSVCASGTYCPPGSINPTPCPVGSYNPNQQQGACIPCPAGTFANKIGQTVPCTTCSAGKYSPSGSTECIPCPAGSYSSLSGQGSCIECGLGFYSGLTGSSVPCTSCPAGISTSQTSSTSPSMCDSPCAVGTGGPGCFKCSAGQFTPFLGMSACQTCPPGTGSIPGAGQCLSCSSNSTCKTSNLRPCVPCASIPHCTNCSAGSYSTIVQAI